MSLIVVLSFTAVLLIAVSPCPAVCPPDITFTKSTQTLGVLRTFALDVGDIDLDSDIDVFVASYHDNYFGPSQLWLNDGTGTFSRSSQSFPLSDVHGVAVRDLNGDTYPDILLISQASSSRVFFNNGTGTFTGGSQNIGVPSDVPFQVEMGDVDNDGDLDAVIACAVGTQLWLNDGTGVFTLAGTLAAGRAACVSLADFNGDRFPDLFLAFSDQFDEVWLNDGSGAFVESGQVLESADGYGYPTSGDIDGDDDIDIAVGNSVHGVTIWLNQNNTGTFVDVGVRLEPGTPRVGLFDANGDGGLDLITAHPTNGTRLWVSTGPASFASAGQVFGPVGALAIACADLDDDVDLDVVFGYSEIYGGNPVYINETDHCYGTTEDIDGNVYRTVKIGTQVWMAENLKVTHYRNGDEIPCISDSVSWVSRITGAYCNYANDTNQVASYGSLYNWHAVADIRNIAPGGWHVPTAAEWQTLCDYLGGEGVAGWKLKEAGTAHWQAPNSGSNESGFSALPAGYRGSALGVFADLGNYATFWTATAISETYAWYRSISYDDAGVGLYDSKKHYGFSIRCVQDVSCCAGRTGNANGEGVYPDEVTLGDIMLLVDVKFISGDCSQLTCIAEADVNQDGGSNPTCEDHVSLGDIMTLVDFLFISNTPLKDCL